MYEPNYNQSSSGSPIQPGVSPFKPEYDEYEAHYLISLYHPDFQAVLDKRITVYDRIETILPMTLTPIAKQRSEGM